ncbi:hypothetical protein NDA18_000750 [Ustilago nuda]|nr:hypothetical protein NDA18_002924 [Ustilago nuda]KAJ1035153.1 hypothetical protein NDA18_000750 [Ustilago nuda]
MSRSQGAVIDLTEDSPPANTRYWFSSFGAAPGPGTHIHEWSFGSHAHQSPSDSFGRDTASSSSAQRAARPAADSIVVGSDDEDEEDMSFTITGQSEPIRRTYHLQRSVSLNTPAASSIRPSSASAGSSLRFHDSIGRGPHGSGSRIPQSIGMLGSSSAAQHPLLPRHRAALPSASATATRRSGGAALPTRSDGGFMSRLSGEFSFGGMAGFGFGPSYSMEVIGNLIRGLQSNADAGYQQGPERKVPQDYDPKWTHPYEVQPGFTHNIIEPPVDLDTYFDDKAVVTGPLPDTTPICSCCRHALVTGANGDERIWVLPCGHVIDGRCVDKLSGIAPPLGPDAVVAERTSGKGKGKAKAVEPPEDEPPAKASRTSSRNRPTASAPATAKEATPKKPKKPKRFNCPVQGCGQRCTKEPGSKYSAWEVFV